MLQLRQVRPMAPSLHYNNHINRLILMKHLELLPAVSSLFLPWEGHAQTAKEAQTRNLKRQNLNFPLLSLVLSLLYYFQRIRFPYGLHGKTSSSCFL